MENYLNIKNHNLKRIAVVMCVVLVFVININWVIPVYADTNSSNPSLSGQVEMICTTTSLQVGDVIEVNIYVHDLKFAGISGYIQYDTNVFNELTRENLTINPDANNNDIDFNDATIVTSNSNKMVIMSSSGTYSELSGDGLLATIKFTVKKAASATTIKLSTIEVDAEDAYYEDSEGISCTITDLNKDTDNGDFALSADSVEAAAGSDVNVPLSITKNPGINALGITIQYDSDVCSYNGLTVTDAYQDKLALEEVYAVPGGGTVRAAFISADDIPDTGVFANLSFTVKDGVAVETASDISVTVTQVTNKGETDITGSGATATLTVTEQPQTNNYALGDVNGDGKINLTDAVYVLLSYNKEKILSEAQTLAADVNKDGGADLLDARQILKYFNGELETF